jgi:DNA ligase D
MPSGVELSNPGKVFWPEEGLTKGDLLAYVQAVSPFLLPALRNRPLTVIRYPDGIQGFSFYQKNTPKYAPDWVRTITLHADSAKRDVAYTVCNSNRTLRWLANQAAIEFHPWLSRADRLERPDHLVMDLDPPEDAFAEAVEVAFAVREVLGELGLRSALKTSGSKGVHLYVPLQRRHPYSEVRAAAEAIGAAAARLVPDLATTEFRKAGRGGRVFLDAGRVAPGAHIVAPYSPRARPHATVSFPVAWRDLRQVSPGDFTIRNVPSILARRGDLWRALMPEPQRLPRHRLQVLSEAGDKGV